ncbi:hypothetical protein APHAL10511_001239 [Amanita phalloides]|nr:hypothetical protein APHAL10511_001239 [Amanita phalloides]
MFNSSKDKTSSKDALEQVTSTYPHRLSFYDRPPTFDVTVEEFETSALDRLRILAEIESSAARNKSWAELKDFIDNQCKKYLPLDPNARRGEDSIKDIRDAERRKDHISHFVLRLAFCRSEDLRRRFVKAETTLFKIRYDKDQDSRAGLLLSRNFDWLPVDEREKEVHKQDLVSLHYKGTDDDDMKQKWFTNAKFHKVRWTRVPDLVEKRSILLKNGWAYVPEIEQASMVYHEFEVHLEKAMEVTARALPRLDEDTRLLPILENLSKGFIAGVSSETYDPSSHQRDEITAEMVDDLAKQHFPMCMRTLHEKLRRDDHLKHYGRLHYGLFLKVLGLSVEEAIVFWMKSLKVADDKFNKEHKYNIRHSYGLEGKRANYPAKSCVQLLTCGTAEPGCPYRQYSRENLSTALVQLYSGQGVTTGDVVELMGMVKGGHYHAACTRVFEITHGVRRGEGIGEGESVTHPNQYAARSRELAESST